MQVTIIGAGNVGSALAHGTVSAGHDVVVTARDAEQVEKTADAAGARASTDIPAAVAEADVVVLAVPYPAVADVAKLVGDEAAGKVIIDATNPLQPDLSGLVVTGRSGGEEVQALFPQSRVVKAFNTVLAGNQATGTVAGTQLDGFYAGDDQQAKQTVADLLTSLGYRPVDAGPLASATPLEHLAFLNISLNAAGGWSWQTGWRLVGPLG